MNRKEFLGLLGLGFVPSLLGAKKKAPKEEEILSRGQSGVVLTPPFKCVPTTSSHDLVRWNSKSGQWIRNTQVKDKNGREIWEGDIIEGNGPSSSVFWPFKGKARVRYSKDNCRFDLEPLGELAKTWGSLACYKGLLERSEIVKS